MNQLSKLAAFAALLWLSSCTATSFSTYSDYDKSANFKQYATYRIEPAKKSGEGDPVLNSSLNQKRINEALNIELKARGYEPAQENADLIVRYQTDEQQKQDVQNYNNWGYWSWWNRNNTSVRNYDQTRLVVDLVDAKTDELVWQGWATGELRTNKKDRQDAFREIVYEIMQKYRYRAGGEINQNATSRR